ncbi:matrixin family metalloprotease [Pendulispora brunnea]|uniref:Matrixin family metalloprotease n=1 Tax=Pendulispora brunnea TaxID=2905690 RepID=A0ABZ2K2K2_9BACT
MLVIVALAGAMLGRISHAHGFCRTMTGREANDPPGTNRCAGWNEREQRACCPHGKPLYWKNACIGYSLQKDASRQVSLSDAERVFARAFETWTKTTCSTDAASRVSIQVSYLGPVECGTVGYNSDGPNQNVIVFRDGSWDHMDATNTLGLTTVRYDPSTGEMFDADMEINAYQRRPLSIADSLPSGAVDLPSIATHEAGHVLGFAHSSAEDATMFAAYRAMTMRDLSSDDTSGICGVYKPDQNRVTAAGPLLADACDPTPRHGYTSACVSGGSSGGGGCSVPGDDSSQTPPPLALGLSALSLVLLRRLRTCD